jgi:hypothetical protein
MGLTKTAVSAARAQRPSAESAADNLEALVAGVLWDANACASVCCDRAGDPLQVTKISATGLIASMQSLAPFLIERLTIAAANGRQRSIM